MATSQIPGPTFEIVNCQIPVALAAVKPLTGNFTAHDAMIVTSIVCAALTVLICLGCAWAHASHYFCPAQQRYLIRIVMLPAVFAFLSVWGVGWYQASPYLLPAAKFYEAICVASLFELYISDLAPGAVKYPGDFLNHCLGNSYNEKGKSGGFKHKGTVRLVWFAVYQMMVVNFGCMVASWVIVATECPLIPRYMTAHRVIEAVSLASTLIALAALITVHVKTRAALKGHKAVRKLLGIKLLVLVVQIETLVFAAVKPSPLTMRKHLSYLDIRIGLLASIICAEMLLFALLFAFLYSPSGVVMRPRADHAEAGVSPVRVGLLAAAWDAINPLDLIQGLLAAFFGIRWARTK